MKRTNLNIILFLSVIFALTLLLKANSADNLTVEVQNLKIKTLPSEHNFIGVNWHGDNIYNHNERKISYNEYIFSNQQHLKAFIEVLRESNIDIIRYPGGENISHYFWDIPNEKVYEARKKWHDEDKSIRYQRFFKPSDRLDFPLFLKFCKEAEFKATIQVNPHTYFDVGNNRIIPLKTYQRDSTNDRIWSTGKVNWKLVEEAAKSAGRQVKWVKQNGYSSTVKYWEIGNEEMVKVPVCPVFTGNEYGRIAAMFMKEMKTADPSIKIILTGAARPAKSYENFDNDELPSNVWGKSVLTELSKFKNQIYAVSAHTYPYGNTKKDTSFTAFRNNILNNSDLNLRERLNFHEKQLNDSGFTNTVIFLNEFNASHYSSSYARTWLGSIGNAEIIMSCANVPSCHHVDYFQLLSDHWTESDIYTNRGFGLFHYAKDFQKLFILQPVANVISLLNENIKGNVLKTVFNNKGIEVVSSSDAGLLRINILNKEKSRTINLKLSGFDNHKYTGSKMLGIDVAETFTTINTGDSRTNPSEVRLLNTLEDAVKINSKNGIYTVDLPANTLSVFYFKKG